MSERWACRLVNQPRGTQRYQLTQREDEDALARAIVEFASEYGRYGYRRITALLKRDGWQVGKDRVERIWRREGLKVPQKQKPRGRLWFNDGSCVRLRPEHANHVWSYDFVSAKTYDGRTVRMLNLIDEHSRECLMIRSERKWSSAKVIEALADVMVAKGVPEHLRSDNGPEFVAKDLRKWLAATGAKTLYIEPGSPWENGYCESFNSKLRDEFLNGEIDTGQTSWIGVETIDKRQFRNIPYTAPVHRPVQSCDGILRSAAGVIVTSEKRLHGIVSGKLRKKFC